MPTKFDYYRAKTLEEAISLLVRSDGRPKVIAGGTDLLVAEKRKKVELSAVVDITWIPGLNGIGQENGDLIIGATTTHHAVATDPVLQKSFPALAEGSSKVGSRQVRNVATIGGNICNASPSAETAPALLVYDTRMRIAGATGNREVPVGEFFTGPGMTVLRHDEVVTHFVLPTYRDYKVGSAYLKLSPRRAMDTAVVGVAAMVAVNEAGICQDCRIALGAVAPTPIRVPEAERIAVGQIQRGAIDVMREIGEVAAAAARPISDVRASADYRRRMVAVMTVRALQLALDRAG